MHFKVADVSASDQQMVSDYIRRGLTYSQVAEAIEQSVICTAIGSGNFGFSVAWGVVKYKLDKLVSNGK